MAKIDWSQYEVKEPSNKVDWSQYEVKDQKPDQPTTMQKFFEALGPGASQDVYRYAVANPLIGSSEVVHNLINTLHGLAPGVVPKQGEIDYSSMFGVPREQNLVDKLTRSAPEIAATIALPEARLGSVGTTLESIPKAGKYLKTALANAIPQGLFAATQSPEHPLESGLESAAISGPFSALAKGVSEGSPLTRLLSKGIIGVGAGGAGYLGAKTAGAGNIGSGLTGLGAGLIAAKYGINPSRVAKETALEGVTPENTKEALEAANRLGLKYITPAEATNLGPVGATQGGMGKTPEGSKILYKAGQERLETEKSSIKNLFDTVFNKKTDPIARKQLYDIAKPQIIPDEKLSSLKDNEIFKDALEKVQNRASFREKLKGVPENSIEYLDMVKRRMGDMISSAKRSGDNTEASLVKNTQSQLMDLMDESVPEYKQARAVAERGIVRKKLEDVFNSKPMTGTNFGKFLQNEKKYSELQNNLRNVPEAQQMLKDMRLVFPRLINVQNAKGAEASSRTSMSKSREFSDYATRQLKELLSGGGYDKNAVNLITNPNWIDELTKLRDTSKMRQPVSKLIDISGKLGGQYYSKNE